MTRAEAKALGLKRYMGPPCKHGHSGERYTCNGDCVGCKPDKVRAWQAAHADQYREQRRQRCEANRDRRLEAMRRWRAANPDRVRENKRRWAKENPEKMREKARRWRAANPDKVRERRRLYRLKNREQHLENRRRQYQRNRETWRRWAAEHPGARERYSHRYWQRRYFWTEVLQDLGFIREGDTKAEQTQIIAECKRLGLIRKEDEPSWNT
jgi:hypothetical protein